jgi:leucyl aminopeptidase
MEIKVETGSMPEHGTVVVPVGHDGGLSAAATALDQASGGLIGRALRAAEGERRHGKVIDLFLPAGLALDRIVLLVLGKPEGLSRLDFEQAGGTLAQKLRGLGVREGYLAGTAGLELGLPPVEIMASLALGAALRAYRFTTSRVGPSVSSCCCRRGKRRWPPASRSSRPSGERAISSASPPTS